MRSGVILLLVVAACSSGESRFRVDTLAVGDTTVIRTFGDPGDSHLITLEEEWRIGGTDESDGHVFGSIGSFALVPGGGFVLYDPSIPALQLFDGAGNYVRTLGRSGTGPGEYLDDIGVVVTTDGVVAQLDPRQARINRYLPGGEVLDAWPAPGVFWTGDAIVADTMGRILYQSVLGVPSTEGGPPIGYRLLDRNGTVIDTIMRPTVPTERRPSTVHHPQHFFLIGTHGHVIRAEGSKYAIDLDRPNGPLRIERVIQPVTWQEGEREQIEAMYNFGRAGEPVQGLPAQRSMIDRIRQWSDGTIWVTSPVSSERIPDEMLNSSTAPPDFPVISWRARSAYDAYRPDGTWLGRLTLPSGAETLAVNGDRVWLALMTSEGAQVVARYRMRGGGMGRD